MSATEFEQRTERFMASSAVDREGLHEELLEIRRRFDGFDGKLDTMQHSLDGMSKAFPGGDPEGHRRAHELQIAQLEERRRLRMAIQEKTISGLIWAAVVWASVAAWEALTRAVRGN